ncbi:xylulokinase [Enterococcus sp. AZ103]|uniref:xylulokinase n=1 Tax=Enterococcus sp. AZ103 TaxID=2774628 RepID=UPI003F23D873
MRYVLGIDLGTSSLTGIVMNQNGQVVAERSSDYSLSSPQSGFSEQNPADWIAACDQVLTELVATFPSLKENLAGISFSGQMHSLVVLGEEKQPIYPAILWNDVRTSKQCQEIMANFGEELLQITKNIALEGFTLPKILWLQENEPKVWGKVRHLMLPKDYLSFYFTDQLVTDYSDAAGTLLLDVEKRQWSREILEQFKIDSAILPKLVAATDQVGVMKSSLTEKFGFTQPVKIFAGGADNACGALGAGLVNEDAALISIGTSGVFSSFEKNIQDYQGKLHFFNHVIPNSYYSMGVTLAAGNSLSWFKDSFAKEESFSELLKDIGEIPAGSEGLLFAPYIVGERTPHFDSQIRGSFIGIDTRHQRDHFARAVLEGITFSLKDSQLLMEETKNKAFKEMISVGGGAKNPEWLQMQADIFNAKIKSLVVEQGPGAGACMIAAIGCGWGQLSEIVTTFVNYQERVFFPNEEKVAKYAEVYTIWQKVYQATKDISSSLLQLSK